MSYIYSFSFCVGVEIMNRNTLLVEGEAADIAVCDK